MFTLNVGFLGCNGERGKEKSKVNFNCNSQDLI